MKTRSEIREKALQFLYLLDYQAEDKDKQLEMFLTDDPLVGEEYKFFIDLVEGVLEESDNLDKEIEPALVDWRFDRLPILDRYILRMGLYEIYHMDDIPPAVSISEAVNLAKKYCDDNARSYINAVLGTLERKRKE